MTKAAERISYDKHGTLDEIVTEGVHLERMDKRRWFLLVTRQDGSQVAVWFGGEVTLVEERPND